jgi:CBS-domain-containing membrane protein
MNTQAFISVFLVTLMVSVIFVHQQDLRLIVAPAFFSSSVLCLHIPAQILKLRKT